MSILIYEPDPLVCSDINETLSAAFPQCKIDVLEAFDITKVVERISEIAVAVFSVTQEEFQQWRPEIRNLRAWFPVVLIVDDTPQPGEVDVDLDYLARPFSSTTLLKTVSDALSDLR
jgi:DNA-binding NtrC family response regulator